MFRRGKTAARGPNEDDKANGVVLAADRLWRAFDDVQAVRDLSLSVHAGELYGLVGPDGAGKTTTLRLLTGLLDADRGEARAKALPLAEGGQALREAIGYMPQQYSLYGDLSVMENLRFFGRLFGLDRAAFARRTERLLAITRLAPFADRRADALSGGMYKKLGLAAALLHQPEVLILDEPSNGVDPVSRRELWELLHTFVDEGMAVLIATPYMDEAERCHKVGLLDRGRLLTEGPPDQLIRDFPHRAFEVHAADRGQAETALGERPEVLALSPHGADLRIVVRVEGVSSIESWAARASPPVHLESVRPDFDDVFLGWLADHTPSAEVSA